MSESHAPHLIDEAGRITWGPIDHAITEINYKDFDLSTEMGKRAGPWRRHFAFHQFQFFGLFTPRYVIGAALVDIRYVGVCFFYLFDKKTQRMQSRSFRQPLAMGMGFSQNPEAGPMHFKRGKNRVEMRRDGQGNLRHLQAEFADGLKIDAQLKGGAPLRLCTRSGASGWVYTEKNADQGLSGEAIINGEQQVLEGRGLTDWSAGYMRRNTFWNWAALSTTLESGETLGLNLACGVNETSFSENALWLGGKRHRLSLAAFEYDVFDQRKIWRVRSGDGVVDLKFTPLDGHGEEMNAIVLASHFTQWVGHYEGEIRLGDRIITLPKTLGFAEHHYAKW